MQIPESHREKMLGALLIFFFILNFMLLMLCRGLILKEKGALKLN